MRGETGPALRSEKSTCTANTLRRNAAAGLLASVPAASPVRWAHVIGLPTCLHRWHNHLCPEVSKEDWSQEEDELIQKLVQTMGTKWSKIVKMLPGRTDNAIKNRWNSTMRKNLRRQLKGGPDADLVGGVPAELLAQATLNACEELPVRKRGSSTSAAIATAAAVAAVTSEMSKESSRAPARRKRGMSKGELDSPLSSSPAAMHANGACEPDVRYGSPMVPADRAGLNAAEGIESPAKRRASRKPAPKPDKLDLAVMEDFLPEKMAQMRAAPVMMRPPSLSMGLVNHSSMVDPAWVLGHFALSPPGTLMGGMLAGFAEFQPPNSEYYAAPPTMELTGQLPTTHGLSPLHSPLNIMGLASCLGLDLGDRQMHMLHHDDGDSTLKHGLSLDVS